MSYELWDTDTANSLASFEFEDEALRAVAEIVGQYRSRRARRVGWLMLTETRDGQTRVVGRGEALAERAGGSAMGNREERPGQARGKRAAA